LQLSWHSGDANAARATQREVLGGDTEAGNITPQQVGTSTKFSENQEKRVMLLFHIFHLDYQKYEKHHHDSDQSLIGCDPPLEDGNNQLRCSN